jgi:hypothetical protein
VHRSLSSIVAAAPAALALAACVTINIYFPAAAAERAADRIIDEVLQVQPGAAKPAAGKPAAAPSQQDETR